MKWNRPECYLPLSSAFLCGVALLPDLPYGFFMLLRWLVTATLSLLAFRAFENAKENLGIACLAGAILFNPIFKIHLGRDLWWFVDLAMIPILIVLATKAPGKETEQ